MSDSERIEAAARGMWCSDDRVNQIAWAEGDQQLKSFYRILASTTLDIGDRFNFITAGLQPYD